MNSTNEDELQEKGGDTKAGRFFSVRIDIMHSLVLKGGCHEKDLFCLFRRTAPILFLGLCSVSGTDQIRFFTQPERWCGSGVRDT